MNYVLQMPEWLRLVGVLFFTVGIIAGIMNLYYATRDIIDYYKRRRR